MDYFLSRWVAQRRCPPSGDRSPPAPPTIGDGSSQLFLIELSGFLHFSFGADSGSQGGQPDGSRSPGPKAMGSYLLDKIMILLQDPYVWIPLYAFLLYYGIRKGNKKAWVFIILSLATFAVTDSLSAQILKPLFGRLRPCNSTR
jgi:hypothetical protein